MKKQIAFVAGTALCVGAANAQMSKMGAAGSIVPNMKAVEAGGHSNVRNPILASLTYDGSASYGFAGQDFESVFDIYDTFLTERITTFNDANLTEFRSTAFGNGNPFGAADIVARVYDAAQEADLCDNAGGLPVPIIVSTPGAGFYDGVDGVTTFDANTCLAAGDYLISWAADLEFGLFGQLFWFGQFGAHDTGGGAPDDGFQSAPGDPFGTGVCAQVIDPPTGLPTGLNFILCGDATTCGGGGCNDPTSCGDWDGDGDSDGDDFFAFLDDFFTGAMCADIDGDGDRDADDFFAFLDAFVNPC